MIPIPVVGAVVGSLVGGIVGSTVGHGEGILIGNLVEVIDNKLNVKNDADLKKEPSEETLDNQADSKPESTENFDSPKEKVNPLMLYCILKLNIQIALTNKE